MGPVAERLVEPFERLAASQALQRLGPLAEPTVLKYLRHPEHRVRLDAAGILKAIGTRASLNDLQQAVATEDALIRETARSAIDEIKKRYP